MYEFDPEEQNFSNTAHDYGTLSRRGEFDRGSKLRTELSVLRSSMEATGTRFKNTPGGKFSNPLDQSTPQKYGARAKDIVSKGKSFIPNTTQYSN